MNLAGGFDQRVVDEEAEDAGVADMTLDVGGEERRMHVRAYNHWVSLLNGRPYPSIEDLDPESIADFGAHSVLLDFSNGVEDPAIQFLGRTLRQECGIDTGVTQVADVPSRSLLSRLTDHYLQIIANRAPIGFEAEFVNTRGYNTVYRGILMPFSSDADSIDFIYGVINWKELVDADLQARLTAEIAAARREAAVASTPVWADGPSAGFDDAPAETPGERDVVGNDGDITDESSLADRLAHARASAEAVQAADGRSRAALYRALGRAHAFACAIPGDPETYAELLDDAGIRAQARAPMTPVVKLVFGMDYDKTRLTEYAAVLAHAQRLGVAAADLGVFLDGFDGGIKGVVAAERAARRPVAAAVVDVAAVARTKASLARVDLAVDGDAEFVVLLARRGAAGTLDVVASIADDNALTARALRRVG